MRQRPPAYSAVKVDGGRAYELARRGEEVELAEREVDVSRFETRWREGERAAFAIECSSGTYVRSLSPTWAMPTAWSCAAPGSGRSTSPTPTRSGSWG